MKSNTLARQVNSKFPLQWLILSGLGLVLVAAQSFALYTVFTSKFPGANDFFVRWLGGREYLLHGVNPFDRSVAEKAQMAMFGRLARPGDKDEAYFAYPLYTLYFFWPLSLLPYAWAQAIWMTLLQFMLLALTILSMRLSGWQPPNWLFWLTVFWGIFFYNGARAIILGQFSILVALALLLALWAIQHKRDRWAGIFLAVATIKPQMIFLALVFLIVWALARQRRSIVISFGVSMVILVASSMLLVPSWPLDFINNARAYSDYVAFGTPLENLLHYLLPAALAAPLTMILSLLFFLALLPGWWLALRSANTDGKMSREAAYTWAIMSTLVVSSLITFRSATANQVILYLPLFFFFRRLSLNRLPTHSTSSGQAADPSAMLRAGRRPPKDISTQRADSSHEGRGVGNRVIAGIEMGLAVFMWVVFVVTLEGNWEHIMMHGLLPALMLLLYIVDWQGLWRAAQLAGKMSGTEQPS